MEEWKRETMTMMVTVQPLRGTTAKVNGAL